MQTLISTNYATVGDTVNTQDIKRLSALSSWKSLVVIAVEWFIIISAALLHKHYPYFWLYIPAWLVIGTRLYALYSLIHEAIHFSISRNKKWNDFIAQVFLGFPLFIHLEKMRAVHLDHHKYLHTEKDPERKHLQYPEFRFPLSKAKLAVILLKDISGFNFIYYTAQSFVSGLKSSGTMTSRQLFFSIFYAGLFAASLILGFAAGLLLYWIIPFITVYQLLNRLRLYTEHFNMDDDNEYHTRSLLLPAVSKFFLAPYNLGYHLGHHLYPGVPFYNLPELQRLLENDTGFSSRATVQKKYTGLFKSIVK